MIRCRLKTEDPATLVERLQAEDCAGKFVYGIVFREAAALLERAGLDHPSSRFTLDGAGLLYVGSATIGLRRRVGRHYSNDSRMSSLRLTLACLLEHELALKALHIGPDCRCSLGNTEQALTKWMMANTRIAYHRSSDPVRLEKTLIKQWSPPLNISHQKTQPFAQRLMDLRRDFVTRQSTPWVPAGPVRRAAYEKLARVHVKSDCDPAQKVERGVTFASFDGPQISQIDVGQL